MNSELLVPPPPMAEAPVIIPPAPPVWRSRLGLLLFVCICIYLGLWLVLAPWRQGWSTSVHSFFSAYPIIQEVLSGPSRVSYFLRGMISGLGLVDLWMGVNAGVNYRDPK